MHSPVFIGRRQAVGIIGASIAAPSIMISAHAEAPIADGKIPDWMKGSGEVIFAGYGGAGQEAERKAFFDPFEKATGIKVREVSDADPAKVKAMVDTGNLQWDVFHGGRGTVMNLMKQGDYLEKIDYSMIDDGVGKEFRYENGLEIFIMPIVLGYRTDVFKTDKPNSWADFWNTQKFPGPRAMWAGVGAPEMEIALLAAGVPKDKLYPVDVDKALASYDKIKKNVVKWYTSSAAPGQLLTDKEVVMTTAFSARLQLLKDQGVPLDWSWNEAILKREGLAVVKGAKNKANAMKLLAYVTMAAPQARLASIYFSGVVNSKANKLLTPQQLAKLPSAPEHMKQAVIYNYEWWIQHQAEAKAKFDKWLLR